MRCTCQNCGEYMVQDEKGLFSRCICPNCFLTCSVCLGTAQKPLSPEALRSLVSERAQYDRAHAEAPESAPASPDAADERLGD